MGGGQKKDPLFILSLTGGYRQNPSIIFYKPVTTNLIHINIRHTIWHIYIGLQGTFLPKPILTILFI